MRTTRLRFEKVSLTGHKTVACAGCATPVRRQSTFWQTLNPFNLHELTRKPKDRAQILTELRETRDAWMRAAERCRTCQQRLEDEGEA